MLHVIEAAQRLSVAHRLVRWLARWCPDLFKVLDMDIHGRISSLQSILHSYPLKTYQTSQKKKIEFLLALGYIASALALVT